MYAETSILIKICFCCYYYNYYYLVVSDFNKRRGNINTIPNEILVKILSYLPTTDLLLNVSKVSKRFYELTKNPLAHLTVTFDNPAFKVHQFLTENDQIENLNFTSSNPEPFAYLLDQWFSTFGSWRPTKHKNTQFGDPNSTIIELYYRFWRPKSKCRRPKSGSRPTC